MSTTSRWPGRSSPASALPPSPASPATRRWSILGGSTFSFGAAYLGTSHTPFIVDGDPSTAQFQIPSLSLDTAMERRLADRSGLSSSLDRLRREVDAGTSMRAKDDFDARALDMLTSPAAREAFDLSRESDLVRDRYGRHRFGQRALLARRLVEAGSTFVTVVMEHPGGEMPLNCCYNWDSHAVNCHIFDDAKWRMPFYDQAVTALVEDLAARGLDRRVLLVVTGEFGRTPRLENQIGTQTKVHQPGRDHWPGAQSILVAGGGLRMGQVVGSTDARGGSPRIAPSRPTTSGPPSTTTSASIKSWPCPTSVVGRCRSSLPASRFGNCSDDIVARPGRSPARRAASPSLGCGLGGRAAGIPVAAGRWPTAAEG